MACDDEEEGEPLEHRLREIESGVWWENFHEAVLLVDKQANYLRSQHELIALFDDVGFVHYYHSSTGKYYALQFAMPFDETLYKR